MRKDTSLPPGEGEGDLNETEAAAVEAHPPEAGRPAPVTAAIAAPELPRRVGKLTAMMALEEPARTDALEKAANSGMTVNLRSKTGEDVRWRYGEHILVVPPTPKPFAAAHAIHLLFCTPGLVEEVEE
jgi:hypothetical protein